MRLIISQQQIQHIDGRIAGDVYPFFHKRYNKIFCGFSTAHRIVPNKNYRRFMMETPFFHISAEYRTKKRAGHNEIRHVPPFAAAF